ncbi:MAG TPA: OmpH family outer membrane protein [Chromatiales bacterium]|nr:OmpH family outer membrane protein [Chromatiales bacterium]
MGESALKRFPLVVVLLLGMSLATAGSAMATGLKIGFVNPALILEKAPQAKAASSKLEREFAPRQKKLAAEQADIQKLQGKLARNGEIMSQVHRDKLQRDILTRQREFKRKQDEFREDLNIRRNGELGKLERQIRAAILTVAKDGHYDLIVSDGVLYASKRVDITGQVLQRLEQRAKRPAKK